MKFISLVFIAILVASVPVSSSAWDGYDYKKGAYVEIEKGQLVRPGREIEIYDYSDGRYKDVEVESIRSRGRSVEIEIRDRDSGEYRTLEMDRR